ncbi:hypothetical protein GOP47_0020752 [Adiantum capillus-veneris]|uniref:Uncharacterized protein n=1 Tax=Adiantum capillus-veneris TaxID=13818 RepID=A0A9D4UA50_ADICA|nr:hypothetical protein GOP47_0020752 [Adiantum capillus-veneris]
MELKMEEAACTQALELAFGFAPSLVAKAACELGIPDMLAEAEKPLSARDIADKLQAQYGSLAACAAQSDSATSTSDSLKSAQQRVEARAQLVERMMRFLSTHGIFAAEGGKYSLTPLSAWLVQSGNPTSLQSFLLFQNSQEMLAPWHHLSAAILDGNHDQVAPFNRAHATDVWGLTSANAALSHLLNVAMSSTSHISLQAFLAHYQGLAEHVHTLVDVGGGIGTSASYIAARYPSIKIINFDLPHVVASAHVYPGVEHIGGDMFEAILSCDAIFMKWILHDWSDEDCIKILKNCYKALPTYGKVIIMDAILEDGKPQKGSFSNLRVTLDMVMMAHTTYGKERTRDEWEHILYASNFCDLRFHEIPSPQCIIEAFPCEGK